jgi:Flp pilus assembly pilin Flp
MNRWKTLVTRLVQDDQGQDLIEYALLGGFISIVAIAALTLLGPQIVILWNKILAAVTGAAG